MTHITIPSRWEISETNGEFWRLLSLTADAIEAMPEGCPLPDPEKAQALMSRLTAAVTWQLDQAALQAEVWQEVRRLAQERTLAGAVKVALRVVRHVQERQQRVWRKTEAISLLVAVAHLMGLPGVGPCPDEQRYFEELLRMGALPSMRLPHLNAPYHSWCENRKWSFRALNASTHWVQRQTRHGTLFGVKEGQLREVLRELSCMGLTVQDVRCLQLAVRPS